MAGTSKNSFADIISTFMGKVGNTPDEKGLPSASDSLISKNIITGDGSTLKRQTPVKPILTASERARTYNIGLELAKAMYNFNLKNKKDEKKAPTILSQAREKLEKPKDLLAGVKGTGPMWLKALLFLVSGIAALVAGLMTDGPFKGALKIAAKALLRLGLNSIKLLFKLAIAPFKALIPKNLIGGIVSKGIGGIVKSISGMVSAPFKALGGVFKVGGLFAKVGKFLKPLLIAVKRIPVLGSIISLAFAISRFRKGDVVGGVIDLLSALSALLYLVPVAGPVLAIAIGTGLDVLNAFLDVKAGGATGKQKKAKLSILGDMAKSIGSWIMSKALYIPILGTFKRWGMAYDAFKSGNIIEGLYQFGVGILSIIPGAGAIITGIEILMGFDDNKKEEAKDIKKKTGWFAGLKTWLKSKLMKLPWVIRKPLEWFGILDDTEGDATIVTTGNSAYDKLKGFASSMWNGITSGLASIGNALVDGVSKLYHNVKETLSDAASYTTEVLGAPAGIFEANRLTKESDEAYNRSIEREIREGKRNQDGTSKDRDELVRLGLAVPVGASSEEVREFHRLKRERERTGIADGASSLVSKVVNKEAPTSTAVLIGTEAAKVVNNTYTEILPKSASVDIPKDIKTGKQDIDHQNKLILDQNNLLVQLLMTAKEQLNVIKKGEKSTAVAPVASNNTSINQNNAFSTTRLDGRSMYMSSPYSISPSIA